MDNGIPAAPHTQVKILYRNSVLYAILYVCRNWINIRWHLWTYMCEAIVNSSSSELNKGCFLMTNRCIYNMNINQARAVIIGVVGGADAAFPPPPPLSNSMLCYTNAPLLHYSNAPMLHYYYYYFCCTATLILLHCTDKLNWTLHQHCQHTAILHFTAFTDNSTFVQTAILHCLLSNTALHWKYCVQLKIKQGGNFGVLS